MFFSASLFVVALQTRIVRFRRFLAVAMVRLVVDHEDVLGTHQATHDTLQHLAFGFSGVQFVAGAALQQRSSARRHLDAFAQLEGVIVGNDDLGAVHVVEQVVGHEFAAGVVTVRIVRLEHAEPILDSQSGGDDQKAPGKVFAGGMADRVDRLPSDQHGHHSGLAGPRGQL